MEIEPPTEGPTRRQALQRVGAIAGAAGVVWAAPAVSTLGSAFAAPGSQAPGTRTARITLRLTQYPGIFDHEDLVTVTAAGALTGSGTHDNGAGNESVTGTFTGSTLAYTATYDGSTYSYSVPPSTVSGGVFSATITDSQGGSYPATGTFVVI